jgi:hypothetical protein
MKILVACEYSGIVREAFRSVGHDAISCDILPSEQPGPHHEGDVRNILYSRKFDLLIAHPPCTYLCSSGLHWNSRRQENGEYTPEAIERQAKTDDALKFIEFLWNCDIPRICIENPVGCINTRLPYMPKPQYVQPYEYGHDASKKTGFWLKNLPMLGSWEEDYVEPRIVVAKNGRTYKRWANQTDSGQNALPPSATRGHDRAKTYEGIAWAMVEAWG